MSADLTEYLSMKAEIRQLKQQVCKLQKENSALRLALGRKKRNVKKASCIKHYRPGISGVELAKLANCTPAYANRMIQLLVTSPVLQPSDETVKNHLSNPD